MKKLIYCAAALATALFAGSCQQELLDTPAGETTVTYSVELPGAVTKAIGNGTNVDELVYELWIVGEDGEITPESTRLYQKTLVNKQENKWIVTLNLVQDQTYKVLFWAQVEKPEGHENYNTNNLTAVTYAANITKDYSTNQEDYAAFYASKVISTFTTPKRETVTLKRPFAQLNIGTENTLQSEDGYTIDMNNSYVQVRGIPTTFNVATSVTSDPTATITFNEFTVPSETLTVDQKPYEYVAMNYVFASKNGIAATVEYNIYATLKPTANGSSNVDVTVNNTIDFVPLKENYRTNIVGNLLSSSTQYDIVVDADFNDEDLDGGKFGVIDGQQYIKVENSADFTEAVANENVDIIILEGDINLNDIVTRSATDVTLTVNAGRTLTLDLNGKTLSGKSAQSGVSYHMFNVLGTLTVKNGTIEYEHIGEDMAWNHYAEIFHVGADGTLNMENVTANNKGGSTMAYVVDMSNATNITVNVENSTLKCSYIPVRVFNNSKTGVNNVTIKNSTLDGKYCFWVQYWLADDRDEAILKNTVKLDIFSDDNVYTKDENVVAPILFGYNSYVYCTPNGITTTVSEDGTVVTLGTMVENGVVPRYAAGAEEQDIVTTVVVEDGISVLEDRTFRKYYALETVTLPSTLTALGVAGEQYTSGNIFQGCAKLTNITIPESVTTLGMGTFYGCRSLTSINVPAGVTRIEKDTFRETGLTSIEFHEGVTYFGEYAFRDCESLKEIVIKAPSFTVESNTFQNSAAPYPSIKIYVANAEMKDYLETKLSSHEKTFITVVAPKDVNSQESFEAALAENAEIIHVAAGEYNLPVSSIKDNQTIIGTNGTVFNVAAASISADNVTIKGVTFQNDGNAKCVLSVSGKNPVIEDCVFKGAAPNGSGMHVIGNGETDNVITLKNCDFSQDDFFKPIFDAWTGLRGSTLLIDGCRLANGLYAMHIDGNKQNGSIIVKNSYVAGFVTNGASLDSVTFENCTFGDANGYACVNINTAHSFVNCTFPTKADANNVSNYGLYVVSYAAGKNLVISNCKMSDGTSLDETNVAVANGGFLNWDSDTEAMNVTIE